jgi:2-polyprenyl-6-methoxyphenol hydroxylase-like FAD-dependent oxidoreductase
MLPSGAMGAVAAMQDAVVLTNCLYDVASWQTKDIAVALKDYKEQRYDKVKASVDFSNKNAALLHGQVKEEITEVSERGGGSALVIEEQKKSDQITLTCLISIRLISH